MSRKSLKTFFGKIEADKDLARKLRDVEKITEREAANKVVKIAAEQGYIISEDELLQARHAQVEFFNIFGEAEQAVAECCHWAQGCMPGFCPLPVAED
jgi:predicted ribosomally synthesized peptide with nif11-like leader